MDCRGVQRRTVQMIHYSLSRGRLLSSAVVGVPRTIPKSTDTLRFHTILLGNLENFAHYELWGGFNPHKPKPFDIPLASRERYGRRKRGLPHQAHVGVDDACDDDTQHSPRSARTRSWYCIERDPRGESCHDVDDPADRVDGVERLASESEGHGAVVGATDVEGDGRGRLQCTSSEA